MSESVDLLVFGQGWTGTYVLAEAREKNVSCATTTRDGRGGTIQFQFNPESNDSSPFEKLPLATTVLITFPVLSELALDRLTSFYEQTRHAISSPIKWILLGSTGNFSPVDATINPWCDRHTPLSAISDRNKGESKLLSKYPATSTVLHLAGLYDSTTRNPRNFISRIASTKEVLKSKTSVHYIHGIDAARAIVAVHCKFIPGEGRWIIANMRTIDWWDFLGSAVPTGWDLKKRGNPDTWRWVIECMNESSVKGLPRSVDELGKGIDAKEFWERHGLFPVYTTL